MADSHADSNTSIITKPFRPPRDPLNLTTTQEATLARVSRLIDTADDQGLRGIRFNAGDTTVKQLPRLAWRFLLHSARANCERDCGRVEANADLMRRAAQLLPQDCRPQPVDVASSIAEARGKARLDCAIEEDEDDEGIKAEAEPRKVGALRAIILIVKAVRGVAVVSEEQEKSAKEAVARLEIGGGGEGGTALVSAAPKRREAIAQLQMVRRADEGTAVSDDDSDGGVPLPPEEAMEG